MNKSALARAQFRAEFDDRVIHRIQALQCQCAQHAHREAAAAATKFDDAIASRAQGRFTLTRETRPEQR